MTRNGPSEIEPLQTDRRRSTVLELWLLLGSLAIGLLAPSLVIFCVEVLVGQISPLASVENILRKQFAPGHNLFLLALIGLVPFVALSVVCVLAARRLSPARLACLVLGGLIGIIGLMVPSHVAVWYPLYGPGRMSSTGVIAFLFIPFFCLVTLGIGLVAGWCVSLLPFFRRSDPPNS